MLIPIFPKLGTVDEELARRVEALFEKVKSGEVPESEMADFMNKMTQAILGEVIENPRVKHLFDAKLSSLIGKKLSLSAEGSSPWLIEIVGAPKVLEVRISTEEEVTELPGFAADPEVMKKIISDSASVGLLSDAIFEERLRVVNASPSDPASWIRDLFSMVGPVWDRTDLIQKTLSGLMPKIDEELKKRGC
ncbi:MAG: hypothetical protein SVM80_07935 [Halobacteriota archaeon]|nr:hypothetical protein [Halobacteriota archaeon]